MRSYSDKETDKRLKKLEGRIKEEYTSAYKDLSQKAAEYFSEYKGRYEREHEKYLAGVYTPKEWEMWQITQLARGERWEKMRDDMATRVTNASKIATSYINNDTPSIFALNHNYSAWEIENATGTAFNIYNEQAVKKLIEKDPKLFPKPKVDVPKSMKWNQKKLQSALISNIVQGKGIEQLAEGFRSVTDMNASRAISNARTAYTGAQNAGRVESYKEAEEMGIEIEQEWVATLDTVTRESHQKLDGERIKIGGRFSNGLRYPADPSGEPEEVYGCRCTMVAILPKYNASRDVFRSAENVKGENELAKNITYKGRGGTNSYQEWLASKH